MHSYNNFVGFSLLFSLASWPCPDYRVYAAGGMGSDLRPHNYLQHYDMLKDIWVSLAAMPTPRYAATSFLRGSKIYVLGKEHSCLLLLLRHCRAAALLI